MTFGRALSLSLITAVMILSLVILGGLSLAYADVPTMPDIDVNTPNIDVDVDVPVDGGDINCDIFRNNGEPIPEFCDGGNGGSTPACADGVDNDNDGLVDSADPGCENSLDGDETNTSGGGGDTGGNNGGGDGGGGGGGGGAAPACEDSIDNDGDGLVDMNDSGCENASDTDETNSSGGGGGGGGGGGSSASNATTTDTGAATPEPAPSCDLYLTAFIRSGANNDVEQVKRLQNVLINFEDADIEENGVYDAGTLAAVHAFQTKYATDILTPWGTKNSTGYVFLTTRKKINEIYCQSLQKQFPLTSEELQQIEKVRGQGQRTVTSPQTTSIGKAAPEKKAEEKKVEMKTASEPAKAQQAAAGSDEAVVSTMDRIWRPVADFFKRIFGR